MAKELKKHQVGDEYWFTGSTGLLAKRSQALNSLRFRSGPDDERAISRPRCVC